VEYFVYCRDRPGAMPLRMELTEKHWSFMDPYADAMIARGPTLTPDDSAVTGSVHIVDLPSADALLAGSPSAQAGLYDGIETHLWQFGGRR
jgi:uncharacterized protein